MENENFLSWQIISKYLPYFLFWNKNIQNKDPWDQKD